MILITFVFLLMWEEKGIFSFPPISSHAFVRIVCKILGKLLEFINGSFSRYTPQFFLSIIKLDMGIGVPCYADVAVSHDILQGLGTHTGLCHIGTEGVPIHDHIIIHIYMNAIKSIANFYD